MMLGTPAIRRYRAAVMTCGSPNSSLASLCFHEHHPYLVSLSFYMIPICTLLFTWKNIISFLSGLLETPTSLEIAHDNATHQVLKWTPPFTLNLTAYEDDITGYLVTLEVKNPLPRDPYNLTVSRDLVDSTTNQTWSLPGHASEFFFPRYAFPVWLSVRAESPVGPGAPSALLQYSPPTSSGTCTRLKGYVV